MLNEHLEFQEYTCGFEKTDPKRLTWGNLVKGFSGVPRALSVIARNAYYNDGMNIEGVKHLLNLWCGFEENVSLFGIQNNSSYDNICRWLPRYIENLDPGKSKDAAEKKNAIFRELEKNAEKWNRGAFQNSGRVNDKNSIYFDGIIADAINEGPLRERVLILKKDPNEGAVPKPTYMNDQGLKLIASFLMGRIEGSDFADVDFGSVANWIKSGASEGKKIKGLIDKLEYNIDNEKVKILEIVHVNGDADKFLRLNKKWLERYEPGLSDREAVSRLNDKSLFIYEDKGCSKPLCNF